VATVIKVATAQPRGRWAALVGWARAHIAVAAGVTMAVIVAVVVAVIVLVSATSGGSGAAVAPGSIVQSGPLTTGYRITGKVKARSAASITVQIATVEFAAPEARNVVLFGGQVIEFEEPAQGVVVVARNAHRVSGPAKLHNGDKVTLVGQFTSVAVPPAPAHDGYSFFGVEATSH
jgi:hypothetical protein